MKGTTFIHLNIQSLLPKLNELIIYLLDPKIGVVSLNETWLSDTVDDAEVAVPGFTILEMTEPRLAVEVSPSTSGMSYNPFFCLSCLIPTLNPFLL